MTGRRLLVGWWDPDTGDLVDIPTFDQVADPDRWIMAFVDVPDGWPPPPDDEP